MTTMNWKNASDLSVLSVVGDTAAEQRDHFPLRVCVVFRKIILHEGHGRHNRQVVIPLSEIVVEAAADSALHDLKRKEKVVITCRHACATFQNKRCGGCELNKTMFQVKPSPSIRPALKVERPYRNEILIQGQKNSISRHMAGGANPHHKGYEKLENTRPSR